jgi:poly-gamma-glutamate capsule biosynthesis protein CapA/YwtB (metallophosphatase superfamily)
MKNKFIYFFLILSGIFIIFFINFLNEKINETKTYNYVSIEKYDPIKYNENHEIKLLFVGDIMMTRSVEEKIKDLNKKFIFPFLNILNYLKTFDYVIANLEGPISDKGTKVGSKYSFRMKPEVAEALSNANINVVNLANNHIFDYGKVAFGDTLKNLEKNNINILEILMSL